MRAPVALTLLVFAVTWCAANLAYAAGEELANRPDTFNHAGGEPIGTFDSSQVDPLAPDPGSRTSHDGEKTLEGQSHEAKADGLVSAPRRVAPADPAPSAAASYLDIYGVALATVGLSWAVELVIHLVNGFIFFGIFPPASVPIIGLVQPWVTALACFVVPPAQALAIYVVGALVDDRPVFGDPAALCWTTLASYLSCAALSCVGAGVVLGTGAIIAALLSTTSSPIFYVAAPAVSLVVATGIALVQPFVPVTVYFASRQPVVPGTQAEIPANAPQPTAHVAY
jgi:hypothetical protein